MQQGQVQTHFLINQPPLKHRKNAPSEEEILTDPDVPGIFVTKHDPVHACVFCGKLMTHIQHHLKTHRREAAIKQLKHLDDQKGQKRINSQTQIDAIQSCLRNKGDNCHNELVIQGGKGELLITRRGEKPSFSSSDYSPCPDCLMWVANDSYRKPRHQRVCVKWSY